LVLAGRHHLQLAIVANGYGTIFVAGSLQAPVPTARTRTHSLLPQETKLFLFDRLRRNLGIFDLKQHIFTSDLTQSNIFLTQSDIFQHCSDISRGRSLRTARPSGRGVINLPAVPQCGILRDTAFLIQSEHGVWHLT
jgi:hypothetical protein